MSDLQSLPPHLQHATLDDEKAFKKGRGGMLAAMVGAGLLLIGLVLFLVLGNDEKQQYRELGQRAVALDGAGFKGFWNCAFQGARMEPNLSAEAFMAHIDQRGAAGRGRFGALVREQCMPKLTEMETGLDTLLPPDDLRVDIEGMKTALHALKGALNDYIAHLDTLMAENSAYDPDAAHDLVVAITRAWVDYKTAFAHFNDKVRAKVHA